MPSATEAERSERQYKEAAEKFRKIIEEHGPQSAEATAEAAELRQQLEAYIQSLA